MARSPIKPARTFPNVNAVLGIRRHVRMDTPPAPADGLTASINNAIPVGKNVHIGTIPAGSLVLPASVHVRTALDGTGPAVSVGTEADIDGVITPAGSAVGAAGMKANLADGALLGFVADRDLELFIRLDGGADITVGEFDIFVPFYTAKD